MCLQLLSSSFSGPYFYLLKNVFQIAFTTLNMLDVARLFPAHPSSSAVFSVGTSCRSIEAPGGGKNARPWNNKV